MNNVVAGNSGHAGGGIRCTESVVKVIGNVVNGNSAFYAGGGVYYADYSGIMSNNTVTENSSGSGLGGALYLRSTSGTLTVANNILAYNSSGVSNGGSVVPTLTRNCVYNPGGPDYSGIAPGTSDISADPRIEALGYGLWHIQPDSACVDAGDNSVVQTGAVDIDGDPRALDGNGDGHAVVDIGADESDGTASTFAPAIVRVTMWGSDANDGSGWASGQAKRAVQAGIEAASQLKGEVWVAAGTYDECVALRSCVHVYGGFAGSESTRERRNAATNRTILDGGSAGAVVTSSAPGRRTATVDGFTIRNGKAPGGVYCSRSSPCISNNVITGNTTSSGTAPCNGVYLYAASPAIVRNTIANNASDGMHCAWSSPSVSDNTIVDNGAYGVDCASNASPTIDRNTISRNSGTGVYCTDSSLPVISNNLISNNLDSGIRSYSATPTILNNTITGNGWCGVNCWVSNAIISGNLIAGNLAPNLGGGIYCLACSPTITNNTIVANTAPQGGGIGMMPNPSGPTDSAVSGNIIAFNTSAICKLQGYGAPELRNNNVYNPGGTNYSGLSAGVGDISLDPLFVDSGRADYHLTPASPCVNAGWNDAPGLPPFDVDGQTRVRAGIVDIGADEFWPAISDAKHTAEGLPTDLSGQIVTAAFPDFLYLESPDRVSGIRAEKAAHGMPVGAKADVVGTVHTNPDGERYIAASSITQTGTGSVAPLALNNAWLGGGAFGLQEGVWGWKTVKDAGGGPGREWGPAGGLNNIGLLVTVWGRVLSEYTTADSFTIDDGSGVQVKCIVPLEVTIDPGWQYVAVIGVSSCEKVRAGDHDELRSLLRVRAQTDIMPF